MLIMVVFLSRNGWNRGSAANPISRPRLAFGRASNAAALPQMVEGSDRQRKGALAAALHEGGVSLAQQPVLIFEHALDVADGRQGVVHGSSPRFATPIGRLSGRVAQKMTAP
jgi:hypothetical protein